jgi:hypothetical protein
VRHDGRPVRGLIALLAAAACGGEPPRGPELQITGESTKLRRQDPLPATSAIFDGERVRLRAARGEVLGVVVWTTRPAAIALTATVPVDAYRVAHHRVRRPSTRMYGPSGGAGEWPDRLERVDGGIVDTDRAAYFELSVPRDAPAGTYDATLRIGERAIPVELAIADVTLPDAPPRVWAYVDPGEVTPAWSRGLRRYGLVASPDLGLDMWPAWRDVLADLPYVPVLLPRAAAAEAEAVRGWVAALDGTPQRPFAIPIDEPGRLWQKLTVRARAARVRAAGGGQFLYAVTDRPHFVYGDVVDVYISPFAVTLDRPGWTYNGTPPYAGAMILDTDGVALRTWGWIGWRWRVPLWYVWDAAYYRDRHRDRAAPPTDLDRDPVTFDDGDDRGNLDGVLAYPNGAPSLRLAALRRGMQDRALLDAVEACAGRAAADAIAGELVPTALGDAGAPGRSRPGSWPTDEAPWEAARGRLLDALEACPPTLPRPAGPGGATVADPPDRPAR